MVYTKSNPAMPRELHDSLAHPTRGAPVIPVVVNIDNAATADATFQAFMVPRKCRLLRASYVQESAATAATSFTATLQEKSGPTALSDALDIAAISAGAGADFVVNDDVVLEDGDIVEIVFNETGGSVTAPDLVGIVLELQLLE